MAKKWRKLEIQDTADCQTCEARHVTELELLSKVKCTILENIICPECGHEFSLVIEESQSS
jgi:hypothetical protein